jgi:hypothetical protein
VVVAEDVQVSVRILKQAAQGSTAAKRTIDVVNASTGDTQ